MPHTITIGSEPDGRPVAIKSSLDAAGTDRIAGEADRLRLAAHPGVIELVRFDEVAGVLATAWASGGALSTADVSVRRAASAIAAAATTLVDLHERGLVHGRVDATHLLLGAAGETWLTGFAEPAGSPTAHDDTAAIGAVIASVLAGGRDGVRRRVPPRPSTSRRPAPLATLRERRPPPVVGGGSERLVVDLRHIAERATDASHPATDREVARLLREAVERSEMVRGQQVGGPARLPSSRRAVLLGAMAAAVVVAAVVLWRRPGNSDEAPSAAPRRVTSEVVAPSSTAITPPTTTPPTPDTLPDSPPEATVRWASCRTGSSPDGSDSSDGSSDGTLVDLDGDGCGEPVRLAGHSLITPGQQIEVMVGPQDVVRLGDWTCSGAPTIAVLRHASGTIEVFDRWPTADTPAVARVAEVVPGAVDLHPPEETSPSCASSAHLADGSTRLVDLGSLR